MHYTKHVDNDVVCELHSDVSPLTYSFIQSGLFL